MMAELPAYKHAVTPQSPESYYLDILGGFAAYADSAFLADLLALVERFPDADLSHALNKNQMASKRWLCTELARSTDGALGTVCVVGGWKGVLPAMMAEHGQLEFQRLVSLDIDPECAAAATFLNRRLARDGRFAALTADMLAVDYAALPFAPDPDGTGAADSAAADTVAADTVINTSCEHLADFAAWFARIPDGTLTALQSNDMFDVDVHVNCVRDLAQFQSQAPMRDPLFAGTLPRKRYTRFMLIGRK